MQGFSALDAKARRSGEPFGKDQFQLARLDRVAQSAGRAFGFEDVPAEAVPAPTQRREGWLIWGGSALAALSGLVYLAQ